MDILGLIFEFFLLLLGGYIYRLAALKKLNKSKKNEAYNSILESPMLRYLALLLIAIMLINITLHIKQLIK